MNDVILSWDPASVPATWDAVRARWAFAHTLRTGVSVASFVALVVGNVIRAPGG
jgi:hypothetical protein